MRELIDIHSHIVPDVDDGAEDIGVSGEMLNLYRQNGFCTVIATPHMPIFPSEVYTSSVARGFDNIDEVCGDTGIEVLRGSEVRLSPEVSLENGFLQALALAGTQYVLVDFRSGTWPYYAEEALFSLQTLGFVPILAHPERYGWVRNDRNIAQALVSRGVLLQVTLGSLVGAFGSNAQSVARELLQSGLVHFTATDAHSAGSRLQAGIEGLQWLTREHGAQAIDITLSANPEALLNDREIHAFLPNGRKKFWPGIDLRRLLPGY